ncbi:MAG: EamA family transporter [Flavipsychrobacter sp.]|nr:EamA family transporter [Flavipsychrobacter sp.]
MNDKTKAYLALIYICIAWGTTYLLIKIGVEAYPAAFLFAGVRQVLAGLILFGIGLATNKNRDYSRKNILRQAFVGFLLLTCGNGLVTWSEKHIPSGIAALICSLMPIFAVVFTLSGPGKEKINPLIATGLILGVVGVGFIVKDEISFQSQTMYLYGIIGTLIATCTWAFGSVKNKKYPTPANPMFNSGLQLLFGGLFMLLISPAVDDYTGIWVWKTDGMVSLALLIVFGSVIAYAAYIFALRTLPVGITTLYAYVNPLVAVLMGYFFYSEELNLDTAIAFFTIITGVYLVNAGYRRQQRPQAPTQIQAQPAGDA